MPRAEPAAADEQGESDEYLAAPAPRSRSLLKDFDACRCSATTSAVAVACVFLGLAGTVFAMHAAGHSAWEHPHPPPALCGTWPDFRPCGSCAFGAPGRPPHRVAHGDTCDSIAQRFGVPQFDLFNRNRSKSCCEQANISVSDMIDLCEPPTVQQWRDAGHPRQLPGAGRMVASYVGATTVRQPNGKPSPFGLREGQVSSL